MPVGTTDFMYRALEGWVGGWGGERRGEGGRGKGR